MKTDGEVGFEPTNHGIKVRCRTTWLLPNMKLISLECTVL